MKTKETFTVVLIPIRTNSLTSLSEGFKEAAEKFQLEAGVTPNIDLNTLDDRIRIREAIVSGRVQDATALINQIHPELLDNDRYLYFHLQVRTRFSFATIIISF